MISSVQQQRTTARAAKTATLWLLAVLILVGFCQSAEAARDQIRIVGSSTVFPFSTAVAEEFGITTPFRTPIVESTGSGGGIKLFCAGLGLRHPDITNASRRIKASELKRCAENGVKEILEVKIGFDGIVLANSKAAPRMRFSLAQLWLALAAEIPRNGELIPNPYQRWRDIDPRLPDDRIEVLGPPPTSGTRDAFVELAMEGGCRAFPKIAAIEAEDPRRFRAICQSVREDGRFVEAGENDNLIVNKLIANPKAFGIFGFSFLENNADALQSSYIDDAKPGFETITSGAYPIARSLFYYVKLAHVKVVPGMRDFLLEFASEKAAGEFGYLAEKGMIPLKQTERARFQADIEALRPMSLEPELGS